jgi:hypothetical protein
VLIRLSLYSGSLGLYKRGVPKFPAGANLAPAAVGIVRDVSRWKVALEQYNEDKTDLAFATGTSAGVGHEAEYAEALQIIDAENSTGRLSEITRIDDWLEVEAVQAQIALGVEDIGQIAKTAINAIFRAIGLRSGLPTLITILDSEALLPVHLDKTGYVTMKEPYAKYCIPADLARDGVHFGQAVECLAACHAAGVLSTESAAPWLIAACEGLSSIPVDDQTRLRFCAGDLPWLKPHELDMRLIGVKLGEAEQENSDAALAQAILIGRYLLSAEKREVLRQCLTYHSPGSMAHHIRLILSSDPTRDACKLTYGYAPEYLFEQALAMCCR